jgi:isochorismate hydrolase
MPRTLVKTAHNAFTITNLGQRLAQHGVREIRITGIRTEQCCETTARVGSDLGFDTTFFTDATATFAWSPRPASPAASTWHCGSLPLSTARLSHPGSLEPWWYSVDATVTISGRV